MKEKGIIELPIKRMTEEQLTARITAAKNDGDVLEEIAELKRRKSDVEKADS
jgi:hypothetical protein